MPRPPTELQWARMTSDPTAASETEDHYPVLISQAGRSRSDSLVEHLMAAGVKTPAETAKRLEENDFTTLEDILAVDPADLPNVLREYGGMKGRSVLRLESYAEQFRQPEETCTGTTDRSLIATQSSLNQCLQDFGLDAQDAAKMAGVLAHEEVKTSSDLKELGTADIVEIGRTHGLSRVECRKLATACAAVNRDDGSDPELSNKEGAQTSQETSLSIPSESPPGPPVCTADVGVVKAPPDCPVKIVIFTINLLAGLFFSQMLPQWMDAVGYSWWKHVVKLGTMWCLSYIMVHVGYEFDIDKTKLWSYGKDYLVAMTAAGFPWVFVALWFAFLLPTPMPLSEALIAARFAAPTSAGILFSMLEAAGMKETWLFQKARVLAIFDDLDTILLMVPLKVLIVGMRWELSIDLGVVVVLFILIFIYMHKLRLPCSWQATMVYASIVTIVCELVHFVTHDTRVDPYDIVETVHLEVLLPAFAIGCLAYGDHSSQSQIAQSKKPRGLEHSKTFVRRMQRMPSLMTDTFSCLKGETVTTFISAVFMVFVGLSMPALFAPADVHAGGHRRLASASSGSSYESDDMDTLGPGPLVWHVFMVSVLMVLGKMFPLVCYKDEASLRTRLALSLGMCPRGEVGAGVIVISLGFGIQGSAITIAVLCLAINLVLSSVFIMAVKKLAQDNPKENEALEMNPTARVEV